MRAELGADPTDEIEHLRPLHRVEPVGRLVEQDELGVVRDRGGELDPLPLAGGHRPDRTEALLAEADQPERVVRPLHGRAVRQQVHLGEVAHEVARGQLRRKVVVLGRVADARPHLDARRRGIPRRARSARRRPGSGGPRMSEMNVVLPAPLEPSRPVIPGPISASRPASATVRP